MLMFLKKSKVRFRITARWPWIEEIYLYSRKYKMNLRYLFLLSFFFFLYLDSIVKNWLLSEWHKLNMELNSWMKHLNNILQGQGPQQQSFDISEHLFRCYLSFKKILHHIFQPPSCSPTLFINFRLMTVDMCSPVLEISKVSNFFALMARFYWHILQMASTHNWSW